MPVDPTVEISSGHPANPPAVNIPVAPPVPPQPAISHQWGAGHQLEDSSGNELDVDDYVVDEG